MSVSEVIGKIVRFLRAGYPQGVPATDTFALLALLRRRLSDEEVIAIATALVEHGDLPVDTTDIRVLITKLTDQMPAPEEVDRVTAHLQKCGWPSIDEFPPPNA